MNTKSGERDPRRKHRERMRNRFKATDLNGFAPHEVLEFLLFYAIPQKDTKNIAYELIAQFGTVGNTLRASVEQLTRVKGVGENVALFLRLISEVISYNSKEKWVGKLPSLSTSSDAGEYAVACLSEKTKECFYLACLNSKQQVIKTVEISEGTHSHTHVEVSKIAAHAMLNSAKAVVFMHNHPEGICQPSEEDRYVTENLCRIFEALDINVVDHIIVAGKNYTSMVERGLM